MHTAQQKLDAHAAGIAMNPGGWRKPRTSRKHRFAKGNPPTRMEHLAAEAYGLPAPKIERHSTRGDKQRAQEISITAHLDPKRMSAHAFRAMHTAAEAENGTVTPEPRAMTGLGSETIAAAVAYHSPKRFNAQRNARSVLKLAADAPEGAGFVTFKTDDGWSWRAA